MQDAPGVYAVLVGSGMSSAAGIPTGWQVVQDLIRRIARAEGIDDDDLGDAPEQWWFGQGRPEANYSSLLESLAPTDLARRALLRRYFDPDPGDGEVRSPTAAHHALAWLCATGRVRVIITTNFDPLIERALEAAGVSPQVLTNSNSVKGMTPLTHSGVTVIKVHGDYASPTLKNTRLELGAYPPNMRRLLGEVFDNYGLLVVGWSATDDTALVEALQRVRSRRYPMYWATYRGSMTTTADQLTGQHRAHVIDSTGANDLLGDLTDRIQRLDAIAMRRRGPSPMRNYSMAPESTVVPQGWAVLPLLVVRAASQVTPATYETVGLIGPEQRERIVAALQASALNARLRALSKFEAIAATADPPTPTVPVAQWAATPGMFQSFDHATYRLGGDASSGVSALARIAMPPMSRTDGASLIVDMGISIGLLLGLPTVAELFRDGLVLVTSVLAEAIADVMPIDASVTHCELHLSTSRMEGTSNGTPRQNDMAERVDFRTVMSDAEPNPKVNELLGFAASLSGPLTTHEASELAAYALNYMSLAVGFLDPRAGIAMVRQALGLLAES